MIRKRILPSIRMKPTTVISQLFGLLNKKGYSTTKLLYKKTTDKLVLSEVNEGSNVATLTLNRPPVNSLSMEMCMAISNSIKSLESNHPNIQALILKSYNPSILSAGLDLTELQNPNSERLRLFWNSFQQLFLDLYGSRLAIIGAIEGHAPAAGCMLAMTCDYRIMSASSTIPSTSNRVTTKGGGGMIGLNGSKFGMVIPSWLGQLMIRTIGFRNAEKAISLGTLFTPTEALNIGLVDCIVSQKKVIDKSYDVATHWGSIPPQARVASKMLARKKYLDDFITNRNYDTEYICSFIQSEGFQARLETHFERLRMKK